jgi:hypothetical protein
MAPDLDLRPGEPARSTLPDWLQICPKCGATAPDLAALPSSVAAAIRTDAYRDAGADAPEPCRPALRYAALLARIGDRSGAADAILMAAWAADDLGDDNAASMLRRRAAAAWGVPRDERSALRLVDVLRRAGMLYDADARASELEQAATDEATVRIMEFQRARIAEGDVGRHLMSSALRPPASTPHVTHGQNRSDPTARTQTFWSRLLRR